MSSSLFQPGSIDRPLIAFAFLAQTTNANGDLLSGLAPIFKPIARSRVGKRFDAAEFAKEVARLYSLDVHPWAAEDLAPRLERAGLLHRNAVTSSTYEYYYAEIEGEFNDVTEADIRLIVKHFVDFATPILVGHGRPVDEKALENGLFDELIKMDFWAVLRKPDRSKEDQLTERTLRAKKSPEQAEREKQLEANARIDVLCASFILHLYRREPSLYELLVKIASGAMIAETVLNFQNPGNVENLSKLRVILDAPLVMSLLNLASEESHDYTLRICNKLKEHCAQIATFTHSVEELVDNLRGVFSLRDQGKGFGPTARRLASASFQAFAIAVKNDPMAALADIGVKVVTPLSSNHAYQYFSGEDEDKLRLTLGEYVNPTAQRRDAASIATLVRLRSGKRLRMTQFYSTDNIFVTENAWLPARAESFLRGRHLAADGEVPVAITDKYLAGLLLVMFGGKAEEITRSRLLAHCAAALEARSDVIAKMQRFLSEMGQEQSERFRALMTVERAGQHLMQLTLGDSVFVTDTNAAKLLENVEAVLIERERIASEARLKAVEQEHAQKILEAKERLRDAEEEHERDKASTAHTLRVLEEQVRNADAEAMVARQKERFAAQSMQETELRLRESEASELESVRRRIEEAVRFSKRVEVGAHVLLAIIFGLAVGYLAFLSTKSGDFWRAIAIAACSAAVAFGGFWKVPEIVFRRPFLGLRQWAFDWRIENLAIDSADLPKCNIDWHSGAVSLITARSMSTEESVLRSTMGG